MERHNVMWPAIQFSLMATSLATLFIWLYNSVIKKRRMAVFQLCLFFVIMFVVTAIIQYFLSRPL